MSTVSSSSAAQVPHPDLWRGTQFVRRTSRCVDTGHAALSAELPGGGWPLGALTELLLAQPGAGELRLLQAALARLPAQRPIVLIDPPYPPHWAAWSAWHPHPERLLWLTPDSSADALWAADQVLRSDCCAALLFWQNRTRPEALRRLHLAAQAGETLFFMLRPLAAAAHTSPAPLRLTLAPAPGGLHVGILKRRGPVFDQRLHLALGLSPQPAHQPEPRHVPVDLRALVTPEPHGIASVVAS